MEETLRNIKLALTGLATDYLTGTLAATKAGLGADAIDWLGISIT